MRSSNDPPFVDCFFPLEGFCVEVGDGASRTIVTSVSLLKSSLNQLISISAF
jgi:hypothetical protein